MRFYPFLSISVLVSILIAVFEGTMRLTNGASENEGLLWIYHGGNWGTICNDESFSDVEALVACRHLGYDTVTSFATSVTPGMGVIQLDALSCYGYELTLGNCAHGEWGNPSSPCSHVSDVGLSCENKQGKNKTPLTGAQERFWTTFFFFFNHSLYLP